MAIGDELRSVGIIGQGLVSGGQRRRQAKTGGLATALGLTQRKGDIRRQKEFREEDIARADRAQDLQIQSERMVQTEKLMSQAKLSLVENDDYNDALESGDQRGAAAFERQAYDALYSRLPAEAQRSPFAPYRFEEIEAGALTVPDVPVKESLAEKLGGALRGGTTGFSAFEALQGLTQPGGPALAFTQRGLRRGIAGPGKRALGGIARGLVPEERRENVPEWLKGLLEF